ncbi:MAG TPA: ATP synthase F0 subunit A [Anaerolineaceae bacterium]|nr:ATP synthase F0 subunit A [Anaerolineaceae bacterium]
MEKSRKWRWGVNRWWVLAFIILTVIATNRFAPVQQVIAVAPENLTKSPIITLPLVGGLYLTNTEVAMILMDLIILVIALVVKSRVKEYTLIAKGFTGALEMLIEVLYNLAQSTAGKWAKKIFPLFATILIVVLFANLLKLIPGFESIGFVEEVEHAGYTAVSLGGNWFNVTTPEVAEGGAVVVPFLRGLSTDLNFTLALALISVIMTQVIGVQAQGFGYFSKFFNVRTLFSRPIFGVMDLFTSLLEAISEFAKIISFTFRLFGNMFAGMVLMAIISVMVPVFAPSAIMLFELFIGLIQAFVFGMLTLVFMAMATQGHAEA